MSSCDTMLCGFAFAIFGVVAVGFAADFGRFADAVAVCLLGLLGVLLAVVLLVGRLVSTGTEIDCSTVSAVSIAAAGVAACIASTESAGSESCSGIDVNVAGAADSCNDIKATVEAITVAS